ncbi:OsmC family protein [candidate division KSB1 bacterium]|nr:OsmC family protein [candidate division KSB1 bacterium]
MITQAATIDLFNSVNFAQFIDTIDAIKANPALARMTLRAEVEWRNGAQVRIKIHRSDGNDAQAIAQPIAFENGERSAQLDDKTAANAVEIILAGLGSCLVMSFVYHATQRGFHVDELGLRLEAEIDLRGFLGLSPQARPGYQIIRLVAQVKCDAPKQALEKLWEQVQKISPVLDIIRNPVPVTIELQDETNF